MTDHDIYQDAPETPNHETSDVPAMDAGVHPNESNKAFKARRAADKKALKEARHSNPLKQADAKAAIEYANRMAGREWLLPLDTESVLTAVQRLSKEILILSSRIAPPSELDALIDLSEAGISRSIEDPHDPKMWGSDWDFVVEDLNRIERRITMKRTLTEHAGNIIKAQDIELDFRQMTLLVVEALEKRVDRLTGMMETHGDLRPEFRHDLSVIIP